MIELGKETHRGTKEEIQTWWLSWWLVCDLTNRISDKQTEGYDRQSRRELQELSQRTWTQRWGWRCICLFVMQNREAHHMEKAEKSDICMAKRDPWDRRWQTELPRWMPFSVSAAYLAEPGSFSHLVLLLVRPESGSRIRGRRNQRRKLMKTNRGRSWRRTIHCIHRERRENN